MVDEPVLRGLPLRSESTVISAPLPVELAGLKPAAKPTITLLNFDFRERFFCIAVTFDDNFTVFMITSTTCTEGLG
jgi:hypothetical protein